MARNQPGSIEIQQIMLSEDRRAPQGGAACHVWWRGGRSRLVARVGPSRVVAWEAGGLAWWARGGPSPVGRRRRPVTRGGREAGRTWWRGSRASRRGVGRLPEAGYRCRMTEPPADEADQAVDHPARDQSAADHPVRDHAAPDHLARDHAARDHAAPDHPAANAPDHPAANAVNHNAANHSADHRVPDHRDDPDPGRPVDPDVDYGAVDSLIDFDLAVRVARGLMRPGPQITAAQAREVVAELREDAVQSTGHVASVTGLRARPGDGVLVVDRPAWARANTDAFRTILAPAVSEALKSRPATNPAVMAVGRKTTGGEVGALLSFLGSRVLGQFDIAGGAPDNGQGRLLLVAPNIVQVERQLGVDPGDFRLWVCLHEETHRVQFAATPWLREHMLGRSRTLVTSLLGHPGELIERVTEAARSLPAILRGGGDVSVLDLVQTPQQREDLARITAVMSLLEGHADVVMDEVGPQVIPSVAEIRDRFTRRRQGVGMADKLLRRLLGLDAKMRQYRDGAIFVRGVVKDVGMDGFNAVWTSPETLPLPTEILDPRAWVRRVHG